MFYYAYIIIRKPDVVSRAWGPCMSVAHSLKTVRCKTSLRGECSDGIKFGHVLDSGNVYCYIYIYMYRYTHVHKIDVLVCVPLHGHTHVQIHMRIQIYMHIHMHITEMNIYIYIYTYICKIWNMTYDV